MSCSQPSHRRKYYFTLTKRYGTKKIWETTRFISVAFEFCSSFEKTDTTQKTDVTLYIQILLINFDGVFILLKLIGFENSINMATVTAQKMRFSIKDFSSKCWNPADFVTFTDEILNGKLDFLCSVWTEDAIIIYFDYFINTCSTGCRRSNKKRRRRRSIMKWKNKNNIFGIEKYSLSYEIPYFFFYNNKDDKNFNHSWIKHCCIRQPKFRDKSENAQPYWYTFLGR